MEDLVRNWHVQELYPFKKYWSKKLPRGNYIKSGKNKNSGEYYNTRQYNNLLYSMFGLKKNPCKNKKHLPNCHKTHTFAKEVLGNVFFLNYKRKMRHKNNTACLLKTAQPQWSMKWQHYRCWDVSRRRYLKWRESLTFINICPLGKKTGLLLEDESTYEYYLYIPIKKHCFNRRLLTF